MHEEGETVFGCDCECLTEHVPDLITTFVEKHDDLVVSNSHLASVWCKWKKITLNLRSFKMRGPVILATTISIG